MWHLDYVSCLLTVVSTVLVGRRMWQGWVVAGANSVIISMIGLRTHQWGFVPANLFCIAIYLYNIAEWRRPAALAGRQSGSPSEVLSVRLNRKVAVLQLHRPRRRAMRSLGKSAEDERLASNRIRSCTVPDQRESRTPF